ncbi:hypothetical protein PM082_008224 [Marasmius tenuissimus]|nr:hypothetical protein PM082_008224 [Marasmius tenuissimus]
MSQVITQKLSHFAVCRYQLPAIRHLESKSRLIHLDSPDVTPPKPTRDWMNVIIVMWLRRKCIANDFGIPKSAEYRGGSLANSCRGHGGERRTLLVVGLTEERSVDHDWTQISSQHN